MTYPSIPSLRSGPGSLWGPPAGHAFWLALNDGRHRGLSAGPARHSPRPWDRQLAGPHSDASIRGAGGGALTSPQGGLADPPALPTRLTSGPRGLPGCREDSLWAPFEFKPFQGSFRPFLANRGAFAPRSLPLRGSAGSAEGTSEPTLDEFSGRPPPSPPPPALLTSRPASQRADISGCRAHPCQAELAGCEASSRETKPPTAPPTAPSGPPL